MQRQSIALQNSEFVGCPTVFRSSALPFALKGEARFAVSVAGHYTEGFTESSYLAGCQKVLRRKGLGRELAEVVWRAT